MPLPLSNVGQAERRRSVPKKPIFIPHTSRGEPIYWQCCMSLWNTPPYEHDMSKMPASSTSNPLEMFTSCAISNISVGEATIHTLYRPAQPGSDIVLVMIH